MPKASGFSAILMRKGMHHPQPVPAPRQSVIWLGRLGQVRRLKLISFRIDTP